MQQLLLIRPMVKMAHHMQVDSDAVVLSGLNFLSPIQHHMGRFVVSGPMAMMGAWYCPSKLTSFSFFSSHRGFDSRLPWTYHRNQEPDAHTERDK